MLISRWRCQSLRRPLLAEEIFGIILGLLLLGVGAWALVGKWLGVL